MYTVMLLSLFYATLGT